MNRSNDRNIPAGPDISLSRRQAIAGGASLALAGTSLLAPGATARQGHSPARATPEGSDTPTPAGDSPLTTLLRMAPNALVMAGNGGPYWTYCDFARQFASLGMDRDGAGPELDNVPLATATIALMPGSNAYSYSMVEEFTSAIGFQPLLMGQNLVLGDPPEQVTMFKGDLEPEALIAAWEASGYEPVTTSSGIEAWSSGPEGEFEIDHPVQQFVFAAMNNVAIHDDVLIYTNTLALLNAVLDHLAAGGTSSLADEVWGPVIATVPETVVSAMGLAPVLDWLDPGLDMEQMEAIQADLDAVREVAGPMPAATAMIVAVDEGAVPIDFEWDGLPAPADAGTMFVRLGTSTIEDAEQMARVVVARSEALRSAITGAPYSEYIEAERQAAEGSTAVIDFTQLKSPRVWSSMVMSRDVLLFVPDSALG